MTRDEQVAKAVIVACAKVCEGLVPHYYHRDMLAAVAAIRSLSLSDIVAALPKEEPDMFDKARFEKAPCYICGYNGPGYYQSSTHKCAAIYHDHAALPEEWRDKAERVSDGHITTTEDIQGWMQEEIDALRAYAAAPAAPQAEPTSESEIFKAFALSQGFIDAEAAWKNREAAQPDAEKVQVSRSLAERTAALFNSVDPNGQLAREWQEKLGDRK